MCCDLTISADPSPTVIVVAAMFNIVFVCRVDDVEDVAVRLNSFFLGLVLAKELLEFFLS